MQHGRMLELWQVLPSSNYMTLVAVYMSGGMDHNLKFWASPNSCRVKSHNFAYTNWIEVTSIGCKNHFPQRGKAFGCENCFNII